MANTGLAGKVAIVTGAGSRAEGIGNGRAAAILLAREGAKVLLIDSYPERAEDTKAMIEKEGNVSLVTAADITRSADCAAAVANAVEAWGRVDVLVNNVGIVGPTGNAVETDTDGWDSAMRVNVLSMVLMAKFAIPHMRIAGGGAIINISSIDGMRGSNPSLFYSTSKGAIINMTRSMAAHHGPEGIRVNCVAPGFVYTPIVYARAGGLAPELREARIKNSLLQVEGTGWDVGNAVVYLASEQARWITGITMPVDAGTTAGTLLNTTPTTHPT